MSPLEAVRRGDWPAAIPGLTALVQRQPEATAIRCLLGIAHFQIGDSSAAHAHLEAVLRQDPDSVDALLYLGLTLRRLGRLAEAEAPLSRLTRLRPERVDAWRLLAQTRGERGTIPEALAAWDAVIRLTPQDPEGWIGLSIGLSLLGEATAAEQGLRRALELAPGHPEASARLGLLLVERGRLEAAEPLLAAAPTYPEAQVGLATALLRRGRLAEAEAILAPMLAHGAPTPAVVEAWAALCQKQGRPQDALPIIDIMLKGIAEDDVHARVLLLHARAEIWDARGAADRAFADWSAANRLRGGVFDPAAHAAHVDHLLSTYGTLSRLPQAPPSASEELVTLIVGMPRSGTSLLEQMLDRHPAITGGGELKALHRVGAGLAAPWQAAPSVLAAAGEQYRTALRQIDPGARRVIDKMPHNFLNLGLLWQIVPGARVIHCVREPLDVCFSCFRQRFSEGMAYTTSLPWLAAFYAEYERLMAHWQAVLPPGMLYTVSYAELVQQPEATLRGVLSFLDLPWHAGCLRPESSRRVVATASRDEVSRPVYTSSVGRAGPYAAHLRPLEALLAARGIRSAGLRAAS